MANIRASFCLGLALSAWLLICGCNSPIAPRPQPQPDIATYTLSGIVTEETPEGRQPLSGVAIEVGPAYSCGRVVWSTSDSDGFYAAEGICKGVAYVAVSKDGYERAPTADGPCLGDYDTPYPECRWVTITGNTRSDIVLIKIKR